MLRSLHTVSSGVRHAIQPHLLSIQLWPRNLNAFKFQGLQYNTMQCNATQWHSPALEKTLCRAPFLAYGVLGRSPCHPAPSSEHIVMASELERVQIPRPAAQDTTIQCNAMQCNAMAQPSARKNAMSCSVPCIRCPRALAMPSSPIF